MGLARRSNLNRNYTFRVAYRTDLSAASVYCLLTARKRLMLRKQHSCGSSEPDDGLAWRAILSRSALKRENSQLRCALARADARAAQQALLLREADHRIKNHLHLVAGFARGLARQVGTADSVSIHAVAVRIEEIANLHDLLQLSPDGDLVDLGALLHRVRQSLDAVVSVEPRRIELVLDAGSIMTPAEFARPVVMSLSELVMNALRHAFPDGRRGTIRISAAEVEGSLCMVVADDGVGLPPESAGGAGFGMKLVHAMARQIGGTLVAESDRGTRFTLIAPLSGR